MRGADAPPAGNTWARCSLLALGAERNHVELGGDPDAPADGASHRGVFGVEPTDPLHDLAIGVGLELEPLAHGNPLDHQRVALQLDFTNSFGLETTASSGNAPSFHGTPERAGQSAGGRGYHVVKVVA